MATFEAPIQKGSPTSDEEASLPSDGEHTVIEVEPASESGARLVEDTPPQAHAEAMARVKEGNVRLTDEERAQGLEEVAKAKKILGFDK